MTAVAGDPGTGETGDNSRVAGESRWPMACAVVSLIALTLLLPESNRVLAGWVLPLFEGLLLAALIVGDPGAIDRRSRTLRLLSIGLVGMLVLGALAATALLIDGLINGGPQTDSADKLLEAGAIVWVANNLAFALLYWELDGGGAAARAAGTRGEVDFAFPQQLNPGLAPPDWRPQFVDYLYLGFTNATAFSPTDVMPLKPWAKLAMMLQSLVSLVILGLVIARAVNLFT